MSDAELLKRLHICRARAIPWPYGQSEEALPRVRDLEAALVMMDATHEAKRENLCDHLARHRKIYERVRDALAEIEEIRQQAPHLFNGESENAAAL